MLGKFKDSASALGQTLLFYTPLASPACPHNNVKLTATPSEWFRALYLSSASYSCLLRKLQETLE